MRSTCLVLFLFYFVDQCLITVCAQTKTADSAGGGFVAKMESFFKESAKTSQEDVREDRALIRQSYIIEEVKAMGQQAHTFLKKGFDTLQINNSLNRILIRHKVAKDGVFENSGTAQSSRNLTVSYNILSALSIQVKSYKKEVDRYQAKLNAFRLGLDSLSNDQALFIFPKDSAELLGYVGRLRILAMDVSPVINQLKQQTAMIHKHQMRINLELMKLESDMEEIQFFQTSISQKTFDREFVNIWEPSRFDRPFNEISYYSYTKATILSYYYLRSYWGRFILFFLSTLLVSTYIFSLRKKLVDYSSISDSILLRHPISCGLLIGFGVAQFIFPSPPFILTFFILSISTFMLCLILKNSITKYWLTVVYLLLAVFVLVGIDNLILQPSRAERWVILGLALCSSLLGLGILLHKKRHKELREEWILFPIVLMVGIAVSSALLTLFGRFNLAKAMLMAGITNVIACIIFLWIIRLVNEGLEKASSVYQNQERRLFYINYNRLGKRAPTFFYALLIVGWFIIFARNFYEFKFITDPLRDLLQSEHQIGSYHFSFYNLAIFLFIIVISTVLSKIVSFFASDTPWNSREEQHQSNRFKLGSWILLIRIAIIVSGFFLAFSILGIPIQQIGIIIGALGVGIGFGLQTLVNNLVSGLIIAFEKPVNVDDQVEIGTVSGKVKSIGFRSSVISTYGGADLILPNGDLLNAHVLNWTLSGGKKRSSITLEVKYGADLERTKLLLENIIKAEGEILHAMGSGIQFTQVSAQAVGILVYFWIRSSKNEGTIKSNIFTAIYRSFDAENIELAVPKQEFILDRKDASEKKS